MYNANEFFLYDPAYTGTDGDFTDDSVFSAEERRQYLEQYADYLKRSYAPGDGSRYAVPFSEAQRAAERLCPESGLPFETMTAYVRRAPRAYQNWDLYTAKAVCENGCLNLKNAELPPNPCAMYRFPEDGGTFQRFSFRFFMTGEYRTHLNGNIGTTTPGRSVELRNGIRDLVRIAFYANGECYAKTNRACPYNAEFTFLGSFNFDSWNEAELTLENGVCSFRLNGGEARSVPATASDSPDRLFFCGGMFHYGDWRILPVSLKLSGTEIRDFWQPDANTPGEPKRLGEVKLPFAVGGFCHADEELILEKEFTVPDNGRQRLHLESLDPGGVVFLDGRCIASTDCFESFCVELPQLQPVSRHRLRVLVNPRAPEVLYEWHRHQDPYIGWFCDKISLKPIQSAEFSELFCNTREVSENRICAELSGSVSRACRVRVCIRPIWGADEDPREICSFSADGPFRTQVRFAARPWTPEAPCLYQLLFEAFDSSGMRIGSESAETGFRTVSQKNGQLLLNGKRIVLKGALQMQFLPPYPQIPVTHICPTDAQIVWQDLMLKSLNGNSMRLHILGYGSNDARYAQIADRLGILLIWTTRYIDSVEGLEWPGRWRAKEGFLRQVKARRNHPSIVLWEGANEFHPNLEQIDTIYNEFVPAVKSVDSTRLLSPISHLYYAADCYPTRGCEYYNDAGTADQNGAAASAGQYWKDPLVVRSAHPYIFLLGYGRGWDRLRTQNWSEQPSLLRNTERAYLVTEFAVIGRQDPTTPESRQEYFNPYSYEFPDEKILGFPLDEKMWRISQAYQALAAHEAIKQLLLQDADGMHWCCLMGGANDGGYLKPVIDCYGYAKLAYYTMKSDFDVGNVVTADVSVKRGKGLTITPVLFGEDGRRYTVTAQITDAEGGVAAKRRYTDVICTDGRTYLPAWSPELPRKGYYGIQFITKGEST